MYIQTECKRKLQWKQQFNKKNYDDLGEALKNEFPLYNQNDLKKPAHK